MYLQHILLVPLRLTAAALVTGSAIQKKFCFRHYSINNFRQRNGWFIRIVKSLEESALLIKDMTKTIKK